MRPRMFSLYWWRMMNWWCCPSIDRCFRFAPVFRHRPLGLLKGKERENFDLNEKTENYCNRLENLWQSLQLFELKLLSFDTVWVIICHIAIDMSSTHVNLLIRFHFAKFFSASITSKWQTMSSQVDFTYKFFRLQNVQIDSHARLCIGNSLCTDQIDCLK